RLPGAAADDPPAGVVLGAFETAPMIENILATKVRLAGLDMYVFDPGGAPGDRLIYWHAADGKPPPTEASLEAMLHWHGALELLDQRWGVLLTPSRPADYESTGRTAWLVLFAGLFATASLVAY